MAGWSISRFRWLMEYTRFDNADAVPPCPVNVHPDRWAAMLEHYDNNYDG